MVFFCTVLIFITLCFSLPNPISSSDLEYDQSKYYFLKLKIMPFQICYWDLKTKTKKQIQKKKKQSPLDRGWYNSWNDKLLATWDYRQSPSVAFRAIRDDFLFALEDSHSIYHLFIDTISLLYRFTNVIFKSSDG